MGLSSALAGGIVLFGITYVIFTFGGFTDTAASISDISSKKSDLENKLVKTSIDVTIPLAPGTDNEFGFAISNINSEKLWDFENFDVIITYDSSGTTYTETLTHVSTCPPVAGQWCIFSWGNDVLDPEILNDGESIAVQVVVNNNLESGSDLIVVVSTQNGVVDSVTRTV